MARHWFPVDREWVKRRDRVLRDDEDAVIRAARDHATTDEEREFIDALIAERERNARADR